MDLFQAAILGLLQGATEVLPISSSAHLILVPLLAGWEESGLTFDVALHFGSFLAIFVYFRQDVAHLLRGGVMGLKQRQMNPELRLALLLLAGSVPAAIAGKTLEDPIEAIFRASPLMISLLLILFGLGMGLADRFGKQIHSVGDINLRAALFIGCFQCLALIPGVSRSGVTITAALLLGFTRPDAARFSFLLSLPIVAGAALLKGYELARHGIEPGMGLPMLVGVVTAAVSGYIAVAFLLRFVQSCTLWSFVWYRVVLGAAILTLLGLGMI